MNHQGNRPFKAAAMLIGLLILISAAEACRKKNYSYDLSANLYVANNVVFVERGLVHTFNLLLKTNLDPFIRRDGVGIIDKAIIHFDTSANLITIKYQNNMCADSVVRNGQIFIRMRGDFFTTGTVAILYFYKYSEDSRQISGTDSLVNLGALAGGRCSYKSFIDSLVIKQDSGASSTWHSEFQYNIPSVLKLPSDSINPVIITGTAGGWTDEGYNFTLEISIPLVNRIYCPWIREGVQQVSIPALEISSGSIEYVNMASCNNRVTYRFGSSMFEWWINKKKLIF